MDGPTRMVLQRCGPGPATTASPGVASWSERLAAERPGLGEVALFRERLGLLEIDRRRVVRIGELRQVAVPVGGQEWRHLRHHPADLLEGLGHETGVDGALHVGRLERALDAL